MSKPSRLYPWIAAIISTLLIATAVMLFSKGNISIRFGKKSPLPYPFGPPEILDIKQPPALGSLSGVPMRIPSEYLLFPVEYEGESIWEGKRRTEPATLETPINGFGIFVRLPNLSPGTDENAAERLHHAFGGGDPFYPWISVGVRPSTHGMSPVLLNHAWLEAWGGHNMKAKGCTFVATDEIRFGLNVERLMCDNERYERNKTLSMPGEDLLYDSVGSNTIIKCNTKPLSPKGRGVCKHYFHVHEVGAWVDYSFYPAYLKDWKVNQEKITAILKSFAVRKPAHSLPASADYPTKTTEHNWPQKPLAQTFNPQGE